MLITYALFSLCSLLCHVEVLLLTPALCGHCAGRSVAQLLCSPLRIITAVSVPAGGEICLQFTWIRSANPALLRHGVMVCLFLRFLLLANHSLSVICLLSHWGVPRKGMWGGRLHMAAPPLHSLVKQSRLCAGDTSIPACMMCSLPHWVWPFVYSIPNKERLWTNATVIPNERFKTPKNSLWL